jgi:alpha-ketoglutarate-dependent taurine dioxygenase
VAEICWREGDLLVFDNRRLLHSRTAAISPDPDRVLKKVMVLKS